MANFIGLISGTSMDAIDAALVDITASSVQLIHYLEIPYSAQARRELEHAIAPAATLSLAEVGALHVLLGREFAAATLRLLSEAQRTADTVVAIGSHGQTVFHSPISTPPFTLQFGDPNVIAVRTGIATVADFRGMDIAAGGQGAPLVPAFHAALFGCGGLPTAVVNIGGIANVTLLGGDTRDVLAFDTGPGNTLLDGWAERHLHRPCDEGGGWAASGRCDDELLAHLRDDDYFRARPPKSTGREYFNLQWLDAKLAAGAAREAGDVQRTLVELTAGTVVDEVIRELPECRRIIVAGGGTRNSTLMAAVARRAGSIEVVRADDMGYPSAAIEAMAFAWLAYRRINTLPGNLPSATGARQPLVLGGLYAAPPTPPPGRSGRE
jgi:anhydro-N-acetylmuramic acid kinase